MPEFRFNGKPLPYQTGITVLAALQNLGIHAGQSITGEPRGALCGMGVCFECRLHINGSLQKACQVLLEPQMEVVSHGATPAR